MATTTAAPTRGPWNVDPRAKLRVVGPDDRTVAACGTHGSNTESEAVHFENEANARAIAALPDLIDAARKAVGVYEGLDDAPLYIRRLRSALEKAGVSP